MRIIDRNSKPKDKLLHCKMCLYIATLFKSLTNSKTMDLYI